MILIDLSQMIIAGLMAVVSKDKTIVLEEDSVRRIVLSMIRSDIRKFKKEYGQIVICCDNSNYWRRKEFEHYKAGRKKLKANSILDWVVINSIIKTLKEDIKQYFPYKVIDVEFAEADDIIGTLAPLYAPHEKILILSTDGDFPQLQRYSKNIKQFHPVNKKFMISDNPELELRMKIIGGDVGDGIPNIFSPSNSFVDGIRQKPALQALVEKCVETDHSLWDDKKAAERFEFNRKLIDLSYIPDHIKDSIITAYDETKPAPRSKLLGYFMKHRLTEFIEIIGEF